MVALELEGSTMRGQLVAAEAHRRPAAREEGARPAAEGAIAHGFDLRAVTLTREDPVLRMQCATGINFNFTQPVHQPLCGTITPNAVSTPAGSTMSLSKLTASVHKGSSIAANGDITLDAGQDCGDLNVNADLTITNPDGSTTTCGTFTRPFQLRSHPTGITSTSNTNATVPADQYGSVFDHVLTSNDSKVASLANVGIGERFPNIPTPDAANHTIVAPTNPFGGTFKLHTATLTNDASNNWFATAAGGLNGTQDMVFTGRSGVNVQLHVASTSNPTPKFPLPATMDIEQDLHWFCPQEAAGARWTKFATVHHVRTLQQTKAGAVEFVTKVNNDPHTDAYTGHTAVTGVTMTPATVAPSPAGAGKKGGPVANTVAITTASVPSPAPSGTGYTFTIQGNKLGCTIARDPADQTAATVTVGTKTGTITIRATSTNRQFHEGTLTIATPAPAATPGAPGAPGAPGGGGGTPPANPPGGGGTTP
jgi:hypothetical protein